MAIKIQLDGEQLMTDIGLTVVISPYGEIGSQMSRQLTITNAAGGQEVFTAAASNQAGIQNRGYLVIVRNVSQAGEIIAVTFNGLADTNGLTDASVLLYPGEQFVFENIQRSLRAIASAATALLQIGQLRVL